MTSSTPPSPKRRFANGVRQSPPPLSKPRIPHTWQPGDLILDTCEVKQVFTGGGMATVYRVYHREWGIDLAVKSPKFSGDELPPGNVDYYVREAETWVKLGLHPHIVCGYFIRVLDGVPHIFMEFVDGSSLLEAILDGQLYSGDRREVLARLLDIAIQSAWGLNYAHRNGLIHQDVKPANVLLASDGTAKVTDFGMAQAATGLLREQGGRGAGEQGSRGAGERLSSPGGRGAVKTTGAGGEGVACNVEMPSLLVGNAGMTPAYCSPEQAAGMPLTRRSDVWSWAATVLEMFAGELAWEKGPSAPRFLEDLLQRGPKAPSIPPIPLPLAGLLRQCFSIQPEARPHDMEVISKALQEFYARGVGSSYPRSEPHIETLLADTINNRAVSLIDLGKHAEALQLLDEAVQTETTHAAALFNRSLLLWRSAKMTDEQVLETLEDNLRVGPQNPAGRRESAYLLGLVHLERGDPVEAVEVVQQAEEQYGPLAAFDHISQAARRLDARFSGSQAAGSSVRELPYDGGISSVAISSQGSLILSGGSDGQVRLIEAATGRILRAMEGHQGRVQSVALSRSGRLGLSGGWDGEVRLWDLAQGTCLRHFQGHEDFVQQAAFTPGERAALSASNDTTLRLWDFGTGECLRVFSDHQDSVSAVLPLPGGRFAISSSYDNSLRIWDLPTGECAAVIPWFRGCTSNLALAPGGRRLLLAGGDQQLWLIDPATGQPLRNFAGHRAAIKSVHLVSRGRQALSGSLDGTLRLWDLASGRCVRTFFSRTGSIHTLAASAEGPLAVSGGSDGRLRFWLLGPVVKAPYVTVLPRSSKEVVELSSQVEAQIEAAGQKFAAGDYPGALQVIAQVRRIPGYQQNPRLVDIWDKIGRKGGRRLLRSSWISQKLKPAASASTLAFLPNSRSLLTGSDDHCLRLWDLQAGGSLRTLEGHHDRIRSAAVAPGPGTALSGSSDGTLRLWNLETGSCLKILIGHANVVNCVAITPDGKVGLSGSSDSTVRVWDLEGGKSRRILSGHSHAVRGVALTPDGRYGLSTGWDKTLQVWDLASGEQMHVFSGHTEVIDALALAPDGKTAITGGLDGTLRIWDLERRAAGAVIEGVPAYTRSIVFSPEGRFFFTGGHDGSIQVWDLASGRRIHSMRSHTAGVASTALSPDGQLLASAGGDGFILLWRLDWDYEF